MLNAESASIAKVLENKELSDLVTALGCGIGKNFDSRAYATAASSSWQTPTRTATTSRRC